MPADLDRLFGALGAHADTVPLAPPGRARRRGENRRRGRLAAGLALVVVLVGTVLIGTVTIARRQATPAVPPPPTVDFHPLVPVGEPVPIELGQDFAMALVVDDRAFVGGRSADGHVRVGALDLRTGRPAWPVADLGAFEGWHGLQAGPEGIIVAVPGPAGGANVAWMVLDPATGRVRWQTQGDELHHGSGEPVVVISDPVAAAIRGLDWATGQERWRVPLAAGESPRFLVEHGSGEIPPVFGRFAEAGHRLLRLDSDGLLRTYDARTGALLASRPRATAPGPVVPVISDGVLYSIAGSPATRVDAAAIAGTDPPSTVYTARPGEAVRSVVPCGPGRVCVTVDRSADASGELLALQARRPGDRDAPAFRELWRRPIATFGAATSVAARILTTRGQLYDLDGRDLSGPMAATPVSSGWITPGSVLRLSVGTGAGPEPVAAEGVSTGDGSTVDLGRIPEPTGICSWDTRFLACPSAGGLRAWRFAG